MFKNLKAEMIRQNVTASQISELLGIKLDTVRRKINAQIKISIDECFKIKTLFKENNSIDYLFKLEKE